MWNRSNVFLLDGILNNEGETAGYVLIVSCPALEATFRTAEAAHASSIALHEEKTNQGLLLDSQPELAVCGFIPHLGFRPGLVGSCVAIAG